MVSTLLLAWIVGSFLVAPIIGRAMRGSRLLPVEPVATVAVAPALPVRAGSAG
ncbi:MAG: hypothetical protein K8J09_05010 [Planctomycetes bacterium]|nr:hypothetical protein [Planctomycetota bacterium]